MRAALLGCLITFFPHTIFSDSWAFDCHGTGTYMTFTEKTLNGRNALYIEHSNSNTKSYGATFNITKNLDGGMYFSSGLQDGFSHTKNCSIYCPPPESNTIKQYEFSSIVKITSWGRVFEVPVNCKAQFGAR